MSKIQLTTAWSNIALEYSSSHIIVEVVKTKNKYKTHSDSIQQIRNHTLSCTILCVTPKVNFIKQLLKGGKTSKVFIACRQLSHSSTYNPATKEMSHVHQCHCGTTSFTLCPRSRACALTEKAVWASGASIHESKKDCWIL